MFSQEMIFIENPLHSIFLFFEIFKIFEVLVASKLEVFRKTSVFSGFISRKSENKVQSKVQLKFLMSQNVRYDVSFPLKKTDRKNIFSP